MEVREVRGVKLGGAFVGRLERVVSLDGSEVWFAYASGGVCVGALPGSSSEEELVSFVSEVFAHV